VRCGFGHDVCGDDRLRRYLKRCKTVGKSRSKEEKRRQEPEVANKERIYPTRSHYTQTDTSHKRDMTRIESYNENKQNGGEGGGMRRTSRDLTIQSKNRRRGSGDHLTLSQKLVLRSRLLVVVFPGCKVGIRIGFNIGVDVVLSGKIGWITCIVD